MASRNSINNTVFDHRQELREAFLWQARYCRDLDSPFVARLCELFAQRLVAETSAAELLADWPTDLSFAFNRGALPLRLVGALHNLVITDPVRHSRLAAVFPPSQSIDDDALWSVIIDSIQNNIKAVSEFLKLPPQTNEVRRSTALLPGFLTIASITKRPLVLSEIGASAGLNMLWDRFHYQLGELTWGDEHSPVRLTTQWSGATVPKAEFTVNDRAGCDLSPLNLRDTKDRQRLLSYVWADQFERKERIQRALELAATSNIQIDQADALDWLQKRLSSRSKNAAHVVYHSIVWGYLNSQTQGEIEALLNSVGKQADTDSPLAWLRIEHDGEDPGAPIILTLWPDGNTHFLGRADYHGRWVRWHGIGHNN